MKVDDGLTRPASGKLQLGVGTDAIVYTVDSATGAITADASLEPHTELPDRVAFNQLMDEFGR